MANVIVLGYDESPSADAALAATIRIAPVVGAKVVVVFGFYISPLGGQQEGSIREALENVGRSRGRPRCRRSRGSGCRSRISARLRQARGRPDRRRERGRCGRDRRRDGRGEPDHGRASRLRRTASGPALPAADTRRADERGLMAVAAPAEIDRDRVRELIAREGERLDERTRESKAMFERARTHARRGRRLVVPDSRAVADLPRPAARASTSGTSTATSISTSTTASGR